MKYTRQKTSGFTLIELLIVLVIIGVLGTIFLGGFSFTKPRETTELLQRQGYNNIQITGYGWWRCSEDDLFKTRYIAYKGDQKLTGTACSGFFKGTTLRWD